MDRPTVVVAFSGGLASSFLVARFARTGHRVVTVTVDTGGSPAEDGAQRLEQQARALGAERHVAVDARDELFARHLVPLIQANLAPGGPLPLSTCGERGLQAERAAEVARSERAPLAHGARGPSHDPVRFAAAFAALAPEVELLAPLRDAGPSRADQRAFLEEHGLLGALGDGSARGPYATEESSWAAQRAGGELREPWEPPAEEAWPRVRLPQDAEDLPEELDVELEAGVPVAASGAPGDGVNLLARLARLGRRHGIGRGTQIEDAPGRKERTAYEAPAAHLAVTAHRALERLVLTPSQLLVKEQLALAYADHLQRGLARDPVLRDIEAFLASSQARVTGTVRLAVYRGSVEVVGVTSPHALAGVAEPTSVDLGGYARVVGAPAAAAERAERSRRAGPADEAADGPSR